MSAAVSNTNAATNRRSERDDIRLTTGMSLNEEQQSLNQRSEEATKFVQKQ